jgi:hypothetical protein
MTNIINERAQDQIGREIDGHDAAEISPCIKNLRNVKITRHGEEGGEPGDAHRQLALRSPCSRAYG